MRRLVVIPLLMLAVATGNVLTARQAGPAQLAFEAARKLEVIDHDLPGAISQYRAIVAKYASERVVVSETLLRLAGCQEQLGQPEARTTYERLVKEYPNTAPAKVAQKKLAAFGKEGSGLTITRLDGDNIIASGAPSMDGGYLSFTDLQTGNLAVRDLKSGRSRGVTDSGYVGAGDPSKLRAAGGSVPSPDGRQIAYLWMDGPGAELRVISSRGGAAKVLCCSDGRRPWKLFGWSMDGKQLLFGIVVTSTTQLQTQLLATSTDGGIPRVLRTVEGPVTRASWSPDGRFIIYGSDVVPSKLFIMRSDGSDSAVLLQHAFNDQLLDWFPDGKHVLFVSDRNGPSALFAQRIADGHAVGGAVLVTENRGGGARIDGQGFTRDGSYHYRTLTRLEDVLTFRLDASGGMSQAPARLPGRFLNFRQGAAWSPDGTEIVFVSDPCEPSAPCRGVPSALSIQSVSTGQIRTVPTGSADFYDPAWMPDGLAIIVQTGLGLSRINLANGAVTSIAEFRGPRTGFLHPVVSLDGREVLYTLNSSSIHARDLSSGVVRVVFEGPAETLALSPDGRFIAVGASRNVQGKEPPVRIVPLAGGPQRSLGVDIETGRLGTGIAWSPDGRYVWFTQSSDPLDMPLWRVPVDGGPAQRMSALAKGSSPVVRRLSSAPDGSMAVSLGTISLEQWVMRNIPKPDGR